MNKNLIITTISLCTIILILSAFLATTTITTNNITTLTTTLNTQADKITQLNQNLTNKITQSNQNLTNQIFQLNQNIANQLTQINHLNAIINDQKNTITAYNHTLTQLQQQQNQSFTSIADQQSTLNAYNQTMTNYQQQTIQNLTYLTQNLTSLDTQITDLNTRLPIEQYDYIIYIPTNTTGFYVAKNGQTGQNEFTSTDAASTINYALSKGKSIYVLSGTYLLSSDVLCYNKKNVVIDGEWATLRCVNHKIVIRGSSCLDSQDNRISGFTIIGGTVRIENSYKTEISNMIFQLCSVAIELANTDTWTECTKIDNVSFTMCTEGIVFRTPAPGATGSYGNTMISRCYFNLRDDSVAINVELDAGFTDGQMENVRIWICGYSAQQHNQTGLLVGGSLFQSVMVGVVFESFATGNLTDSAVYAVRITTDYATPILQEGITFLGSWTNPIYNPLNSKIYGEGSTVAFKQENVSVPVGVSGQFAAQSGAIKVTPATISSFKLLIMVSGSFGENETLTVRIHLGVAGNTNAAGAEVVEKTFTCVGSLWLSDYDMLQLLPSQDVINAVFVEAKSNFEVTDVVVGVSAFGATVWSAM